MASAGTTKRVSFERGSADASTSSPGMPRQHTILRVPGKAAAGDIFDAEDFEAVKFINQIYPDGEPWLVENRS